MAGDRSLLDRLNALKPTSVSLDSEESIQTPIARAEPPSREDALSARLRTLRNGVSSPSPPPPDSGSKDTATQAEITVAVHGKPLAARRSALPLAQGKDDADLDPLFEDADESALDELLASLDIGDDEVVAPPPQRGVHHDPEEESRKVAALLEELRTPASKTKQLASGGDESDDSEGEEMGAEVDQVLSQAVDEAELARSLSPEPEKGEQRPKGEDRDAPITNAHESKDGGGRTGTDAKPEPDSSPDEADPLNLPTVPSKLVDPAPGPGDDPFENDIAARMAKLKGLGAPAVATDSFGLPSAPSFNPDDRPSPGAKPSSGHKRLGYTDEDQKTWCIVCLDDATIRCVGCDNDVYCARCWKDMHVGPAAGYDERGHQWVKFERQKD